MFKFEFSLIANEFRTRTKLHKLIEQSKKREKGKIGTKGEGGRDREEPETPPTISLSLFLKLTHSLSLSLWGHGRRLASPLTATYCRREKGTPGPLSPRQPPPKATNRRLPLLMAKETEIHASSRPKPATHVPESGDPHPLGLLYKLGVEFELK